MPSRSLAPRRGDPETGAGEVPDHGRPGPAGRGVDGNADGLVDHHDGVVVVDDLDPLDDLGDHLERVGLRPGSSRPASRRRARDRSCRRPRSRRARGPGRSGRPPWCGTARTSAPWRRRRARRPAPPVPGRSGGPRSCSCVARVFGIGTRSPRSVTPRMLWRMMTLAAPMMHMSAMLKTGQLGSIIQSMTWPRRMPGSRMSRSVRLPPTPPSRRPRPTDHSGLASRRLTTSTTHTATTARQLSATVNSVPVLNAAPGLCVRCRTNRSPTTLMSRSSSADSAHCLVPTSRAYAAAPTTAKSHQVPRRRESPETGPVSLGFSDAPRAACMTCTVWHAGKP